ncbi:MAG: LamG domain-containing protein [Sandaracinaceae bacterium]
MSSTLLVGGAFRAPALVPATIAMMRSWLVIALSFVAGCTHDWGSLEPDLDEGLLLELAFEGGEAVDRTASAEVAVHGATPSGSALSFDGDDDLEVTFGAPLVLGRAYTVSAWIRPEPSGDQFAVLSCHGEPGVILRTQGSRVVGIGYDAWTSDWPDYAVTEDEGLALEGWQHVALTVDESDLALYVDGERVRERSVTPTPPRADHEPTCWIGRSGYSWMEHHFVGEIDEVRIYGRTLAPREVEWLAARCPGDCVP